MRSFIRRSSTPRIFLGLGEVSGFYKNLSKGFRHLDIPVTYIDLFGHKFEYGGDDNSRHILARQLKQTLQEKSKVRDCTDDSWTFRVQLQWISLKVRVLQILFFLWALFRHDVFILSANSGFFFESIYNPTVQKYWDLPIMKWAGKRVIYVFHGGDSSAPYLDIRNYLKHPSMSDIAGLTVLRKKLIQTLESHADAIVTTPVRGHLHEQPFISQLGLGLPVSLDIPETNTNSSRSPNEETTSVRILHAPSNPIGKGSLFVRHAVDLLKRKNYDIEYIEITDAPHEEVIRELRRCDFVVDQVFSYALMAGLASEAAYLGKPTLTCGYYVELFEDDYPSAESIPPVHFCHPGDLLEGMEKLVEDVKYRKNLGRRARRFVRTRWAPDKVAARLLKIAIDDVPDEWWYHPKNTRYINGWGLSDEQLRTLLYRYLEEVGEHGLMISDKPILKKRLIDYAERGNYQPKHHDRTTNGIVEMMHARARRALLNNRTEEARRLLTTCRTKHPGDARTLALAAILEAKQGDFNQFIELMTEVLLKDPQVYGEYSEVYERVREIR